MRERLGDREPPRGGFQVVAEQRERDVVGVSRLLAERGGRHGQALGVMLDQLPRTADRIGERLAVTRERERRLEVDRRPERSEIVAERIGSARGPQADGRGDPAEKVVGGDEHAAAEQHQLAVGVAGRGNGFPARDDVAGIEELRIRSVADEGAIGGAFLDQLVGHGGRNPVPAKPLDEDAAPVLPAPDERALRIVDSALRDGGAGQLGKIRRRADVVRVKVGDHDPSDGLAVEGGELARPSFASVGQAEPGVDRRPAVVAGQEVRVDVARPVRERKRDPADSALELVHDATLCAGARTRPASRRLAAAVASPTPPHSARANPLDKRS